MAGWAEAKPKYHNFYHVRYISLNLPFIFLYFDSSKDEVVPYILNKDDESLYSKAQKDLFYQYQKYIEESQQIIVQMQVTVAEKYWNSYRFYYESSMPKKEA